MSAESLALQRIADALERIADSMEKPLPTKEGDVSTPVVIKLDGEELTRRVVRYSLSRAARGPSQLFGGNLVTGA